MFELPKSCENWDGMQQISEHCFCVGVLRHGFPTLLCQCELFDKKCHMQVSWIRDHLHWDRWFARTICPTLCFFHSFGVIGIKIEIEIGIRIQIGVEIEIGIGRGIVIDISIEIGIATGIETGVGIGLGHIT